MSEQKRYRVWHEVRPDGAIGVFTWQDRVVYAKDKDEAREIARRQWQDVKHETRGAKAEEVA